MRSNRRKRIGFVFVALLLTALSAPAQEAAGPQVLWLDSAHTTAAFVSERLLNQSGLGEQLLKKVDRERLALWRIDVQQRQCMPRSAPPAAGSAPDAISFDGLIGRMPLAFVGTVTDVELGYSPWYGAVSRLISVRVDDIVRTQDSQLSPNETLAYVAVGGAIAYGESKVCSRNDAGFHQPKLGDRLLVLGGRSAEEPRFLAARFVFPIEKATIKAQPYAALSSTHDVPLEALLSSLFQKEGQ